MTPDDRSDPRDAQGAEIARNILDNLLEGCQIVGPDWRYRYVNESVARQGRRTRDELTGRTMMEVFPGIESTPMFGLLRECMEQRTPRQTENEFVYPDGSTAWFDLRFEPVPEGVFILSVDITARKHAEARIAHLNAVLTGIRNVNQLITREKDPSRLIQQACDCLVEARGFQSVIVGVADAPGGAIREFAGAGQFMDSLRDLLEQGEVPDCVRESMIRRGPVVRTEADRPCGGCPVADVSHAGLDDVALCLEHEGRVYGFLLATLPAGLGADPEEQSLLGEAAGDIAFALHGMRIAADLGRSAAALASTEEQLRQAQKLEAIGQLAGGVAHDFNNILMVQMGYCELMEAAVEPGGELARDLAQVRECAQKAAGLTRQLLAFSRKQTLKPEVLDLNAVAANIEKMLRRVIGEDIELAATLAGDLGRVRADPGQIEQVLMNLAVNARDAMPRGGRLTLETANVDLDEDYARTHISVTPGPYVMLAVSDNGCGMDEATQAHLFEPFFTTKARGKGTGLGLATVYGIVKQSGGNIWVYSEPGQGATFKIYLPRVEAEPAPLTRRETPVRPGRDELILVVEDDPNLRTVLARMLGSLGYRARVTGGGAEALRAVETENLRPDLLITDVVMPGMSGRVLAEHLERRLPGLRILYTSGYTDSAIVHHGVLDSGAPFLQKPYGIRDLAARIREAMGEEGRA